MSHDLQPPRNRQALPVGAVTVFGSMLVLAGAGPAGVSLPMAGAVVLVPALMAGRAAIWILEMKPDVKSP